MIIWLIRLHEEVFHVAFKRCSDVCKNTISGGDKTLVSVERLKKTGISPDEFKALLEDAIDLVEKEWNHLNEIYVTDSPIEKLMWLMGSVRVVDESEGREDPDVIKTISLSHEWDDLVAGLMDVYTKLKELYVKHLKELS